MDPESLVEQMVDDGRRLLNDLHRDHFPVAVAFWAKSALDDKWRLYVASKLVDEAGLGDASRKARAAQDGMPRRWTYSLDVRFLGAETPAARAALAIRDRQPGGICTPYRGYLLGDLAVDGAIIYPSVPIRLTPEDAVLRMVALLHRPVPGHPAKVTLRDGSVLEAVPVGLDLSSDGPKNLKFLDVKANEARVVAVEEVMGID